MALLKKLLMLIVGLIAIVAGISVVISNPEHATVKMLGFSIAELPTGLWLIAAFSLGCLIGVLVGIPTLIKLKAQLRTAKRRLAKANLSTTKDPVQAG